MGVERLVELLFADADDYFFDMANRAESSEDQAAFFEAMRLIRLQRAPLSSKFFDDLTASVSSAWVETERSASVVSETPEGPDFDEITILSDEELEISAALAMISNRGQALHSHQIGCLTQTINSISASHPVEDASNPLGVKTLARLFADAARSLALSPRALARLLILFERDVTEKLGDVYTQALTEVENAGTTIIEPKDPERERYVSRSTDSSEQIPNGEMEFEELRRRLSGAGVQGTPQQASSGNRGYGAVPAQQLVGCLAIAQTKYLEHLSAPGELRPHSLPNLQRFLIATPTEQGGFQHAAPAELDTLKLVSDLFELIFRNPDVSLACMSLIARLQFPVLKIAILDKSFFGRRDHPARQFLNQLARDGIGWPSSSAMLLKHRLYRIAEALVCEINDVFSSDGKVFDRALASWNEQVAKKTSQNETAERRINETELGKAKLNAARSIVERVLNRVAGRALPKAIASFIPNQWSQVLVMICIKFGTQSDEWKSALGALNDLLTACRLTGKTDREEKQQLDLSDLLSRLRDGMLLSGLTGSTHTEAMEVLETVLQTALSGNRSEEPLDLAVMEPVSIAAGHSPRSRKALDPRLKELLPGTWIEVARRDPEGLLRCRLVVLVDQTQTYVFASDDGLKVYERSVSGLLQELTDGTVRILAEQPLVERAMGDLVNNLNSDLQS